MRTSLTLLACRCSTERYTRSAARIAVSIVLIASESVSKWTREWSNRAQNDRMASNASLCTFLASLWAIPNRVDCADQIERTSRKRWCVCQKQMVCQYFRDVNPSIVHILEMQTQNYRWKLLYVSCQHFRHTNSILIHRRLHLSQRWKCKYVAMLCLSCLLSAWAFHWRTCVSMTWQALKCRLWWLFGSWLIIRLQLFKFRPVCLLQPSAVNNMKRNQPDLQAQTDTQTVWVKQQQPLLTVFNLLQDTCTVLKKWRNTIAEFQFKTCMHSSDLCKWTTLNCGYAFWTDLARETLW